MSARMAADELMDFLQTGTINHSVNYPSVVLPQIGESQSRVCICNKNVPNVIANVTSVLSDRGHNVDDLINKSRGEYAYKAIDLAGDLPTEETMAELASVDGVLSCRLLNNEGELWQSMVGAE